MKVLVLSDLEDAGLDFGRLADPALRLIVSCGDVYNDTYERVRRASRLPIFAVHGNHDDPVWPPIGITDLHLKTATFEGLTFGGFEGCWRYKSRGRFQYDDAEVASLLAIEEMPHVDVFVAHNPLAGLHDLPDDVHNGFPAFRAYVERHQPRYFLHGHSARPGEARLGATRVICVYRWLTLEL
ncbi:MAG: metallophosphoesterase family protein [Planctomycetes bacterium]|nr:metallophosphoesterase family protein [Planctomycetota bacterium]